VDLVRDELEGGLPDALVDVLGPLEDVGQGEPRGADAADDGPAHVGARVVGQVEEERLDDGAVLVAGILLIFHNAIDVP
jgi:hypothetical protein